MDKLKRGLLLFFLICASVVVLRTSGSNRTDFILFVTFWAIIWYSWETYQLRQETAWATELENRPLVTFKQRSVQVGIQGEMQKELLISNVGRGLALNIFFSVKNEAGAEVGELSGNIDILEAGLTRSIKEFFDETEDPPKLLEAALDPIVSKERYVIEVIYTDISGLRYTTTLHGGKDGLKFKGAVRC